MNDLMKVLLAKDALFALGFREFHLLMPYVPYARQDRRCDFGEAFSLKVFTDLLNSAEFDSVTMIDAHSDVAPALINNSVNVSNKKYVSLTLDCIKKAEYIHLVSPDSGANKKVNKLFSDFCDLSPTIKCDKRRNTTDGSLSGFEVFTDDIAGADCLIVDDICSRGGTFQGIARALKEKNAGKIYLFVTHYEGVADENKMKESGIQRIFTTNSILDIKSDYITQFKL
jgi:ribose-phosphate pyrophosphokinase